MLLLLPNKLPEVLEIRLSKIKCGFQRVHALVVDPELDDRKAEVVNNEKEATLYERKSLEFKKLAKSTTLAPKHLRLDLLNHQQLLLLYPKLRNSHHLLHSFYFHSRKSKLKSKRSQSKR